ncbi:MAG: ATP-binding protein [Chitinophagaceae bacterium]
MDQVLEFFKKLFDTSDWPPRWHCGRWTEFHGWMYIISDLLIWSAYFAIPLLIIKYISKRKDVHFHKIYFLFAAFILACGSTHFLDAVTFWFPVYRLNALVRLITGVISWITVFSLIKMLPSAFSLKSAKQLEEEAEQRKKVEEELRMKNNQLNEAQQIARLGNWEWNLPGNTIVCSPGLLNIYGLTSAMESMSYENFLQFIHSDERQQVDNYVKDAIAQKKYTEHFHRIVLDDGKVKVIHTKAEVILNEQNEVIKMIGTGQDVTEQKRAEQELLSKSLELEAVNVELQKFAYIASHDLQEPLRKIITFTSLLEKEYKDFVTEKGGVYLDKIISSSMRMQKLIDDILSISMLKASEINFIKTDLNLVVRQVLSDMEVAITSTGTKVQVGQMPVIEASTSQMEQLFQNLISNAIKFRNGDPEVTINTEIITGSLLTVEQLKYFQHKYAELTVPGNPNIEEFCKIYIKDNGIGFEEQYLDKLFVIFQRLHSKTAYEGTGIGLAICKHIVDNHHGLISAKSKIGEGSTFIIILPLLQRNYGQLQ